MDTKIPKQRSRKYQNNGHELTKPMVTILQKQRSRTYQTNGCKITQTMVTYMITRNNRNDITDTKWLPNCKKTTIKKIQQNKS